MLRLGVEDVKLWISRKGAGSACVSGGWGGGGGGMGLGRSSTAGAAECPGSLPSTTSEPILQA